jgi:cell fate (sporulation/competence/biofilm development) regulator YlbF (YheA/YmcA/DUF963 family)
VLNQTIQAPAEAEADALAAASVFGAALKASKEFTQLVAADDAISRDAEATTAIEAFNNLQQQLRAEITTGSLQDSQRAQLDQRQQTMYQVPSVAAYLAAMAAFQAVCRDTASIVSAEIGIDFAANSRSGGCCG